MHSIKRFVPFMGLALLALSSPMLFAQADSHAASTRDGIYTADQAQQGKAVYEAKCGMCHGNTLQGMGPNSPLTGNEFLKNWKDQTIADLFTKTIVMMPALNPGSMTPSETAQVLAYILSANNYPAGKAKLPSDFRLLNAIHIDKP
jgi:S-disulfanyl-L-cysteine oxidoreductase SoxD